ncbi:uncharacterized protein PG998_014587 [Apiospora kogelbergensis]|uniref:uncharacterized protein n=1 Tax=Apiospora kogelbergensis TaxID=1337665 RepID=UPI00313092FF
MGAHAMLPTLTPRIARWSPGGPTIPCARARASATKRVSRHNPVIFRFAIGDFGLSDADAAGFIAILLPINASVVQRKNRPSPSPAKRGSVATHVPSMQWLCIVCAPRAVLEEALALAMASAR